MKRYFIAISISALLLGAFLAFLIRQLRLPIDASIEIARDINIGDRDQGEAVELYIPVINRGRAPLELRNIRVGCGCMILASKGDPAGAQREAMKSIRPVKDIPAPPRTGPATVKVREPRLSQLA
jgi:hypothetical protein